MDLGQNQSDSIPTTDSLTPGCCCAATVWETEPRAAPHSPAAGQKRALFVYAEADQQFTNLHHLGRGMAARVSPSHLGSVATVVMAAPPSMPDECH